MRLFNRFAMVGMVNTLISFFTYQILLYFGGSPSTSYIFSFATGVLVSINLNVKFTFCVKQTPAVIFTFFLANLGSVGFGYVAIPVLISWGLKPAFGQLAITPALMLVNFTLLKAGVQHRQNTVRTVQNV